MGPRHFFKIQLYVTFKIISAHMRQAYQLVGRKLGGGGAKMGDPREKTHGTPASRTWLVSHVARAGLDPTPVTAVK